LICLRKKWENMNMSDHECPELTSSHRQASSTRAPFEWSQEKSFLPLLSQREERWNKSRRLLSSSPNQTTGYWLNFSCHSNQGLNQLDEESLLALEAEVTHQADSLFP
jgi:hypothetical protein